MSKSKETKEDKVIREYLFPCLLRGKKLHPDSFSNCRELLQQYLETEDPEHLFKAIKTENRILQGGGDYLIYDFARDKDEISEFVDEYTIVWESIHNWQWEYITDLAPNSPRSQKITKQAKRYLVRIGESLVPIRNLVRESETQEGLIHIKKFSPHTKPELRIKHPDHFLNYWNHCLAEFERKKRDIKVLRNHC